MIQARFVKSLTTDNVNFALTRRKQQYYSSLIKINGRIRLEELIDLNIILF